MAPGGAPAGQTRCFPFWSVLLNGCCRCVAGWACRCLQAKTTKKIVLRLACTVCKAQHMHAIKVRGPGSHQHLDKGRGRMCSGWTGWWWWCAAWTPVWATPTLTPVGPRCAALQRCKHFEIGGDKKVKGEFEGAAEACLGRDSSSSICPHANAGHSTIAMFLRPWECRPVLIFTSHPYYPHVLGLCMDL